MDVISKVLEKGQNPKTKLETVKLIAERKQRTGMTLCSQYVNKYFTAKNSPFPVHQLNVC